MTNILEKPTTASTTESLPPTLPPAAVERLAKEESWLVPAIVARAFIASGAGLRVKVLRRLLPAVGPLALSVVGGGAFARYVGQARWSALSVSFSDAARVTSAQVYELATYVQQSNPDVTRQILSVLSRDVTTMTALGATLGAIVISYLTAKGALAKR
jgi:hypothetical protein